MRHGLGNDIICYFITIVGQSNCNKMEFMLYQVNIWIGKLCQWAIYLTSFSCCGIELVTCKISHT